MDRNKNNTKLGLKEVITEGYFLFRNNNIQIRGFSDNAINLLKSLNEKSIAGTKSFTHGVERLKDNGLISSRDDWIALLHHPSYRPPPSYINEIGAFIHNSYFQQGWVGNHCVMYPSEFIIATREKNSQSFPPYWHAYHVSVICHVLNNLGVNIHHLLNIPLDNFLNDILFSPAIKIWREEYHNIAKNFETDFTPYFYRSKKQWADIWCSSDFSAHSMKDWGKHIGDLLIKNISNIAPSMINAVFQIRSILDNTPFLDAQNKNLELMAIKGIPGTSILELQSRILSGCCKYTEKENDKYIVSYHDRSIQSPNNKSAVLDRVPFQIFLALLQKRGGFLDRETARIILERISRKDIGPAILNWLDDTDVRAEKPITYTDINQNIRKLRRGFSKIGFDSVIETKSRVGWRLCIDSSKFIFKDIPTTSVLSKDDSFVQIECKTRKIIFKHKKENLGFLPFDLLQLLIRYGGAPVSIDVINSELDISPPKIADDRKTGQTDNVRQYVIQIRKALRKIEADIEIENVYATGWRLVSKYPN
ncbi:MAG: helix-turn-helix domain-containing protein [Proteobacteria bacterium]|nr:helix-turn-helix domain-containing protein [Pseudomonadota bacterium]